MEYGNCIDGDLFNVLKGSVVNMNNQYNDRIDPNQYIGIGLIVFGLFFLKIPIR